MDNPVEIHEKFQLLCEGTSLARYVTFMKEDITDDTRRANRRAVAASYEDVSAKNAAGLFISRTFLFSFRRRRPSQYISRQGA